MFSGRGLFKEVEYESIEAVEIVWGHGLQVECMNGAGKFMSRLWVWVRQLHVNCWMDP